MTDKSLKMTSNNPIPHIIIEASAHPDVNDTNHNSSININWYHIAELYEEYLDLCKKPYNKQGNHIEQWLMGSSDLDALSWFVPYKHMLNVVKKSNGRYGTGKWTEAMLERLAKVDAYNPANYINVTNIVTRTHNWNMMSANIDTYFTASIPSAEVMDMNHEQHTKLSSKLRGHTIQDTSLIKQGFHNWTLQCPADQPMRLFMFPDKQAKSNIQRNIYAQLTKFEFLKPGLNKRQVVYKALGGSLYMHPLLYHNWHCVVDSAEPGKEYEAICKYINDNLRVNDKNHICHFCCKPKDNQFDYYDALCWNCGYQAWKIRTRDTRLEKGVNNKYQVPIRACVTGCRHTVGYFTTLELLRRGAEFVLGTTRFPNIALATYQQEPDYAEWSDRLCIIKADFLNWQDVSGLIAGLATHRINVYINNAFQTMPNSVEYLEQAARLERDPESLAKLMSTAGDTPGILDHNRNLRMLALPGPEPTCTDAQNTSLEGAIIPVNVFEANPSWKKPISKIAPQEIMTAGVVNSIVPEMIIGAFRRQHTAIIPGKPKTKSNANTGKMTGKMNPEKFHAIINIGSSEGHSTVQASITGGHKNHMQHVIGCLRLEQDPKLVAYTADCGFITGIYGKTQDPRNADVGLVKVLTAKDGAMRVLYPLLDYLAKGTPVQANYR
jgi:hypothetical protein